MIAQPCEYLKIHGALASVAQLVGVLVWRVVSSIPGQGTYLGCAFSPWSPVSNLGVYNPLSGKVWRQPIDVSLSHRCLSLSLLLSKTNEKKCSQMGIIIISRNKWKHIELYTLNGWIVWYVNYILINLNFFKKKKETVTTQTCLSIVQVRNAFDCNSQNSTESNLRQKAFAFLTK